jgi:hypothetical protein
VTRRLALLFALLLAPACAGGRPALLPTPAERLHAAVTAARAVYDPDSAGGTGYGTTAELLHRMGRGTYGTPRAWPDDGAFRPGVVYVGVQNGGRLATFWIVAPSGRALLADAGAPHTRVGYRTRSAAEVVDEGLMVIRPGVLSGDMIRSALERAGFHGIALDGSILELADGLRPLLAGGNTLESTTGERAGFLIMRTPADARKAAADAKLGRHHRSAVIGSTWVHYTWTASSPDRSRAFANAVAALRREARRA